MFTNKFLLIKNIFLLQIDFIGIKNCDTFSMVPIVISDNIKNVLILWQMILSLRVQIQLLPVAQGGEMSGWLNDLAIAFTNFCNKLECLSLASLSSQV